MDGENSIGISEITLISSTRKMKAYALEFSYIDSQTNSILFYIRHQILKDWFYR